MPDQSESLFARARMVIPGGVNSPVRAFRAVGGNPRFIRSGRGCRITDVDDHEFIDYVGSWGPLILGHAHPQVLEALNSASGRGTSFGAPTELEVIMAEKVCSLVPSIEKVRLVSSGTEATMSALRLARAFTGRSMVVKFDGCYHGHADSFLVKAGSGVATLGLPDTPGVPAACAGQTLSLTFGDLEAVEDAFRQYPDQIAAIICEPVSGNMGVIVPSREFLKGLIDVAERNGALAIFDEVMTGFRVALGGAQELFDLKPHLTCLGKILGGGLPLGAFGGRRSIMSLVAPEGPVYQAGTLSGNPLAVSAGLTTLQVLEGQDPYPLLERHTARLCGALRDAAERFGLPVTVQRCGSMFTAFFRDGEVRDFDSARESDTGRYGAFFLGLLERGIYLAPSQFEACFVSTAHTPEAIQETIDAAVGVLERMSKEI